MLTTPVGLCSFFLENCARKRNQTDWSVTAAVGIKVTGVIANYLKKITWQEEKEHGIRQEVHQKIWELRQSQTCKQQVTHQMWKLTSKCLKPAFPETLHLRTQGERDSHSLYTWWTDADISSSKLLGETETIADGLTDWLGSCFSGMVSGSPGWPETHYTTKNDLDS